MGFYNTLCRCIRYDYLLLVYLQVRTKPYPALNVFLYCVILNPSVTQLNAIISERNL